MKEIAANIWPLFKDLKYDEDRLDLLYELSRYMCMECGRKYDRKLNDFERICQCWNDE